MSFFRRKSLFVLLIGIILLVVLIGYSLSSKDELSTPEKFIMDSVGWLQSAIHKPASFMIDAYTNVKEIKNTYDENKLLREKLAEYKTLIYEVNELEKENKELRKTLDLVDTPRDFEPIMGNVVARSPERWLEQVKINVGEIHGVERNMAVMTADGMIGKVISRSYFTSTVQLLTGFDQLNRISATVSREEGTNVFGLIEGYDAEEEALIFRIMEQSDQPLEKGEMVVSSNMGGVYPSGLALGTIIELMPGEYGLTDVALVKPAANMDNINEVVVVNRSLIVTDPDEEDVDIDEQDDGEEDEQILDDEEMDDLEDGDESDQ